MITGVPSLTPKRYIIGIDVGMINMGMAVIDLADSCSTPYIEHSTLMLRKNGLKYAKYEEGIAHEMVYYWLQDRWNDFFSKAKLVVIEKQMMTKMLSIPERACLIIETALKSFLWAYLALNGPHSVVVSPCWWKRAVGIEVGNHAISGTKSYYDKSGFHQGNYNPNRGINKERVKQQFERLIREGAEEERSVYAKYGSYLNIDMMEAYFIAKAGKQNIDKLMDVSLVTDNHSVYLSTNGSMSKLSNEKRKFAVEPLTNPDLEMRYKDITVTSEPLKKKQKKSDAKVLIAKKPRQMKIKKEKDIEKTAKVAKKIEKKIFKEPEKKPKRKRA